MHADPVCAEPKLFVGGLRFEVSRDDISSHFGQYGPIKTCILLKHQDTGKSKGCAMVLYTKWAHAEAAVNTENGTASHLSGPRQLIVKFADPQRRQEDGVLVGVTPKKLFVGQVPKGVSHDQVRGIFAPYGEIVDLNVMSPKKDGAMGCAFVTFSTWAAAEAAIEGVDGKFTLPGAANPIAVKMADAKPQDVQRVGGKRGMMDMMMGGGGGGGGGGGANKRQFMGQNMGGYGGKPNMGAMGAMGHMMGMGYGNMMGMGMGGMGMNMMGLPGMMGMGGNMMGNPMMGGMGGGMMGQPGMMGPGGMPGGMMGPGQGGQQGAGGGGMMMGGAPGGQGGQPGQQPGVDGAAAAAGQPGGGGYGMEGGFSQGGMAGGMMGPQGMMGSNMGAQGQGGMMGAQGQGGMAGGMMGGQGMAGMAGGMMGGQGGMMGGQGGMMGGQGGYGGQQGAAVGMMGGQGGMMGGQPGMMGAQQHKPSAPLGLGAAGGDLQAARAWKLFIGQISFNLSEADLFPFFSQFGTILELVLLRNNDGRNRGCGFLIYSTQEEANNCLNSANGVVLPSDARGRPLLVKYANQKQAMG